MIFMCDGFTACQCSREREKCGITAWITLLLRSSSSNSITHTAAVILQSYKFYTVGGGGGGSTECIRRVKASVVEFHHNL